VFKFICACARACGCYSHAQVIPGLEQWQRWQAEAGLQCVGLAFCRVTDAPAPPPPPRKRRFQRKNPWA
jgi:hypothetical protein